MIIKKQIIYPTILSFLFVSMLLGYQNCSKSKKLQLDIQTSSENISATNLRADDMTTLFKGLLDEERKQRIDADAALDGKIGELNADLQSFKKDTTSSLGALNDKAKALEVSINTVNGNLSRRIGQAEDATKALEQKMNVKILDLDKSLKDELAKNSDELKAEIVKNSEALTANKEQTDEQKKLIAEQTDKLLTLIQSYNEFKTLVAVTYATKDELKNIKVMYDNINIAVHNLNIKVDLTKEELAKKLGTLAIDLNARINDLDLKLNQQGKDIQGLQGGLAAAIAQYKTDSQLQSDNFNKLLTESEDRLTAIIITKNTELRDEIFTKINQESLALTVYTKKAISEIANSVKDLDTKITTEKNLTQAQKDDLNKHLLELKQTMADAIAEEQQARNDITDQLKALAARMQRMELDAKETRQMAELNAQKIAKLGADFEAEKKSTADRFLVAKKDVDDKLAALKNDFSQRLDAVSAKSQELVKDLGEDVKAQFATVVSDIAILNNKTTIVENNLKLMIETYQKDRSKLINLQANILAQKIAIQPHIINSINAFSAVQFRFIQILAPDEKHKDFYDADLQTLMASCNGNKDASFNNIMGMDSFQVLSLEYLRLLTLGVRSGDKNADAVFYSYGQLEGENNLSRSISLALSRHTALAGDAECLTKSQAWATKILLFDARFASLAKKLMNDEELDRRIGVLYASFDGVKIPAANLQNLIENALTGLAKKTDDYAIISAQLSIDLLNDAWASMLLTERLRNFLAMENLQTAQGELADQFKAGFAELRKDLDAFKVTTNTRLLDLEAQQGKLTAALKKALDVLVTLASRGNYTDLVLVAKEAGGIINYIPQILPNWVPKITTVQHFFSGPNSLMNKTDTCTGASILPVAGAGTMEYQVGRWNPCWVNFRIFPLTVWGNEVKTIWFRIFGAANFINFKVVPEKQLDSNALFANYNFNRNFDFRSVASTDPALKLTGVFSKGVFDIEVPDLFDYYLQNIRSWGGVTVSITPYRREGRSVGIIGPTLDYRIMLYSPLILDFVKKSMPATISKDNSGIEFDHFGNGKPVTTGWVSGSEAGFLVRGKASHFISRKINGLDLFGQGSMKKNKERAQDGFDALADYDKNNDGIINELDSIYSNLSVWFDYNSNGEAEPGEMVSLADSGVASIKLDHKTIPAARAIQNGNDIRYKSVALSGDKNTVAHVYDVFFSTEKVQYK